MQNFLRGVVFRVWFSIVLNIVLFPFGSEAETNGILSSATELRKLSLRELMNIDIFSVSRKEERAATAAAAVHVITEEDIRRSGVRSIPEALRLAPNLQI